MPSDEVMRREEAAYQGGKRHIILRIIRDGQDVCQLCGRPVRWIGGNLDGRWEHNAT